MNREDLFLWLSLAWAITACIAAIWALFALYG
jgi:hypothetical protein